MIFPVHWLTVQAKFYILPIERASVGQRLRHIQQD